MTTTVDRTALTRNVHFHDPDAPAATVVVTGLIGLFTDPGHVVRAADGEVRQQFAVLFRARAVGGEPHADAHEASEAAWVAVADLPRLPIEPPVRIWITEALSSDASPHLG